jgi:hypothetical protein
MRGDMQQAGHEAMLALTAFGLMQAAGKIMANLK